MKLSREDMRNIRKLMVFAAILTFVLIYIQRILSGAAFVLGIFMPFIVGALIAFILNIPMSFFERLYVRLAKRKFRGLRIASMSTAVVAVLAVIAFVIVILVPQITSTIMEITRAIPLAIQEGFRKLEVLFAENPQIMQKISEMESFRVDWGAMIENVVNFLKNGISDVVVSTYVATGGIVSAVFDFFISFVFALYVLAQKERLANQFSRLMKVYLPSKVWDGVCHVLPILYTNFKNFITCQCLEAVILGSMFVVFMTLFGMPYAVLIGVVISVTALVPIVGAFIGCILGAFLILIISPMQAVIFVIMFLILQQIEGNLIYPRVVGSSVGLPALWVLVAVSVGGSLMGIPGMLIFIPLTSTVYTLLREGVRRREAQSEA